MSCFGYAGHNRVHQKPIGLRLSLADAVQYNSTFRLIMSNTQWDRDKRQEQIAILNTQISEKKETVTMLGVFAVWV